LKQQRRKSILKRGSSRKKFRMKKEVEGGRSEAEGCCSGVEMANNKKENYFERASSEVEESLAELK
jgi:hypothetical protein